MSEEDSSDGSGAEDSSNALHSVSSFNGLTVGADLGDGKIQEIFRNIDKFTIAIPTANGGTDIRHCSIASSAARMLEKQVSKQAASLDSMD